LYRAFVETSTTKRNVEAHIHSTLLPLFRTVDFFNSTGDLTQGAATNVMIQDDDESVRPPPKLIKASDLWKSQQKEEKEVDGKRGITKKRKR
jgi:hypothetical protein